MSRQVQRPGMIVQETSINKATETMCFLGKQL